MERLLWLGQPYFAEALPEFGWSQVKIHDFQNFQTFGWADIVDVAGFEPDVLIVADKSRPPFVLGMENFPCLTVFYSVDSHIHWWHKFYAQAFDAALVSLLDKMPQFIGPGLNAEAVWWSPPFAKTDDMPDYSVEKIWDCLFVGNIKPELMPRRVEFMKELGALLPGLEIRQGNYRKLFPKARTLINYADAGDLNFRVFEAMGCGGCLVSPASGNGMENLFKDNEHFVGYERDNPADAARKISFLLRRPQTAEQIAQAGYQEINRHHRARHRAETLTAHLRKLALAGKSEIIKRRISRGRELRERCLQMLYLHWAENIEQPEIKKSFLAAAQGIQ